MKRFCVFILILMICGSMLSGCMVPTVRINEKPSPDITLKNDLSAETSIMLPTTEPAVQPTEAAKPINIPVAYISIDINPSIELGVDSIDNVITAEACNADGQKVLSACSVVGLNIKEAVKILVAEASRQGFIAADGSSVISISTETLDKSKADVLKNLSEIGALEALDDCADCASVYKDNIEFSIRDEAKQAGISTGKLMLINKLRILDPTITVEQYKDAKISEIINKIKELSGDKYISIMNDDVDCTDGCMDDCSCVDCSDCMDDHCDTVCSDGCNEICVCTDCVDCGVTNAGNATNDVACADECKDDCSCLDCDDCDDGVVASNCIDDCNTDCSCRDCLDCGGTSNISGKSGSNTVSNQLEEAADKARDNAEEKADQEMDNNEIID
jgi:hypothetical protein